MFKDVNIKGRFGFGCMRLKMDGDKVDYTEFSKMIDLFMQSGFNYFDTAHIYLNGLSEVALGDCLAKRYPRDSFILTDKLSYSCFNKQEDIRPFLLKQLDLCKVDYFDFYLMHAQSAESYKKYKACNAYQTAFELKKEGLIKHVGLSFHDTADVLDMILTENPDIEVVQLQFNYLDYEDPIVQSRLCLEVCQKHGKKVIVMEPVRGGRLVNLPQNAKDILSSIGEGSEASFALRFCAQFPDIIMILSGMGNMDMMTDNASVMKNPKPFTNSELSQLQDVAEILRKQNLVACTACRYCEAGCPKSIKIPDIFKVYNDMLVTNSLPETAYDNATADGGRASECIECGKCESACPQQLPIKKLMSRLAWIFEKK